MDNNFDNQKPEVNSVPDQTTEYTDPNAGFEAKDFEKPETEPKQEAAMSYTYGSVPGSTQQMNQGQSTYEQGGCTQGGYGQSTYAQSGYNQGNCNQNDYAQSGYNQNTYNQNYAGSGTSNYGTGYTSGNYNTNANYNSNTNYNTSANYNRPTEMMDTTPLSLGEWLLTLLAGIIPCAGIILYLIWAFGKSLSLIHI